MSTSIRQASWPRDKDALRALRHQVFVLEQGVPEALEWDGQDDACQHFIAETDGAAVGCARLMPTGQIGRMAVLADQRGSGIGAKLLMAAVEAARALPGAQIHLHAQVQVVPFYERFGFDAFGERFMEAGIEHQSMHLPTDTANADQQPSLGQLKGRNLAPFDSDETAMRTAAALCTGARRQILIYSQLLDQEIFARTELVSVLSDFVRSHARAEVEILIHSSSKIRARTHDLVALAQRLSSKFTIRLVGDDERSERRSFIVTDNEGYWLLPDYQQSSGIACAFDPVQAQHLGERFTELSRRAKPDPNLRTLSI